MREPTEANPTFCDWGEGTNTEEIKQLQGEFGLSSRASDLLDSLRVAVRIDQLNTIHDAQLPPIEPKSLRALAIYLAELESFKADAKAEGTDT
ncbi:MAG: hypothetical protein KAJ55_00090 [Anaerolineales bacterium]|nr:hypothetical protein [Anaerolineales bacterium]